MKGSNTLRLNEATLIEALQEYFDKRTISPHQFQVTDVSWVSQERVFSVCTNEKQKKEVKDAGQ